MLTGGCTKICMWNRTRPKAGTKKPKLNLDVDEEDSVEENFVTLEQHVPLVRHAEWNIARPEAGEQYLAVAEDRHSWDMMDVKKQDNHVVEY